MTDPLRGARPVGPSAPPPGSRPPAPPPRSGSPGPPPTGAAPSGGPPPGSGTGGQGSYPPFGRTVIRSYRWTGPSRPVPWLAVLLLVLGIGLLVKILLPELSLTSLIVLALGIAFAAVWLVGHVVGATVPALVFSAWGIAGLASDLGYLSGNGWGSLAIGGALLVGWGLGRYQRARREWALVLGLIFGAIGLAEVSDTLPFTADLAILVPLGLIGAGVYLILRSRLPGA